MADNVALIFGYGPRVGVAAADAFSQKGYKVAVVSRSDNLFDKAKGYMTIQADLSNPASVETIFTRVIKELGHPSVVIYNASSSIMNESHALDQQISDFQLDNNANIVSAYAAAQLAIKSFSVLPPTSSKTFIYTGNKLNLMVVRPLLSQGVGKAGVAHLMHYLAEEHKDSGYRFYFADERKEDGDPVYGDIDGKAHAAFYMELAEKTSQGPWLATFVKGRGYVKFSEEVVHQAVVMGAGNKN